MSRELEAVTTSKRELDVKAEGYLRKMRESREQQAAVEEQLRKELSSQVRGWGKLSSELICEYEGIVKDGIAVENFVFKSHEIG